MTEVDTEGADWVMNAMEALSTNGSLITTADVFGVVKYLAGLSKAEYWRLQETFEAEQPYIYDSIYSHVCHLQAQKGQVRELKRVALVAWLTYKFKQPNLPEITQEDWEPANASSYLSDLEHLPHKQVLAALLLMFTYRLKHPEVMELELGFLLADLIATIVVALDIAYFRSTFGASYADDYYRILREEEAELIAALEAEKQALKQRKAKKSKKA